MPPEAKIRGEKIIVTHENYLRVIEDHLADDADFHDDVQKKLQEGENSFTSIKKELKEQTGSLDKLVREVCGEKNISGTDISEGISKKVNILYAVYNDFKLLIKNPKLSVALFIIFVFLIAHVSGHFLDKFLTWLF